MTKLRPVQLSAFPDIQPDKPIGKILPSVFQGTNADLMAAVAPFYLTGSVCDVTYGEGKWWDRFKPDPFVAHDKFKLDGVDFTALPEDDDTYDTVCFDPPYITSGDASTAKAAAIHDAYGVGGSRLGFRRASDGYSAFDDWLCAGLAECLRVSRKWVLVKCMEFSQGSCVAPEYRFHDVPYVLAGAARSAGAYKWDQIVHYSGSNMGGHNIKEPVRARRHHSYLLVFRKGRA